MKYPEFENHTLIEVVTNHVQSCELLVNLVSDTFQINKDQQHFKVIENDDLKGAEMTLSYKVGDNIREAGRVITNYKIEPCCIAIKNYLREIFIDYLNENKIYWNEI